MALDDVWIQTVSGKKFPLIAPDPDAICIEDIAHALSMLCRFNGHCQKFYSVAEHSVHVSHEIAPEYALLGLLHDASEAYLGDVPSPLKKALPDFQKYEDNLMKVIARKFRIPEDHPAELKRADIQLLVDEKSILMAPEPEPWPPGAPSIKKPERIMGWGVDEANGLFTKRYIEIQNSST